ncbi:MAG: N-acetyltransferase [Clostridia bacterium]|nr:N-acetyltransferase [Clostridia bacterium]
MVRLAEIKDAEQLYSLNEAFNGKCDVSIKSIEKSITENSQELIIVDDENGKLTGFVCVQIKKSFCYPDCSAELTEVFVLPEFRKKGKASRMIIFAEEYCHNNYLISGFELLTGDDNLAAQSVYSKLGYADDGELHMSK